MIVLTSLILHMGDIYVVILLLTQGPPVFPAVPSLVWSALFLSQADSYAGRHGEVTGPSSPERETKTGLTAASSPLPRAPFLNSLEHIFSSVKLN